MNEKPRERQPLAGERRDPAKSWLPRPLAQRGDQLARRRIPLAARSEAAVDHLLEMIAAWEPAHVLAAHRGLDVAVQQQSGEESDLVDVVALLPSAHSAPRDFVRCVKEIEGVGR